MGTIVKPQSFGSWILSLVSLAFGIHQARADLSIQLAWDPSPDAGISGYNLYYGELSKNQAFVLRLGNQTSASVSGLLPGVTYFVYVTAVNQAGLESDPSNIMTWPADPWQSGVFTSPSGTLYAGSFIRLGDFLWQQPGLPACALYLQPEGLVVLDSNVAPNSGIAGFNLYFGDTETNQIHFVHLGTVPEPVPVTFQPGHAYFFYATAIDRREIESKPSSILVYMGGEAAEP